MSDCVKSDRVCVNVNVYVCLRVCFHEVHVDVCQWCECQWCERITAYLRAVIDSAEHDVRDGVRG